MSTTSSVAQNSTSRCDSALERPATGNGAPKFNIRSKKNQLRLKQLMQVRKSAMPDQDRERTHQQCSKSVRAVLVCVQQRKPVSYSMQALHVEVLRPLVDLAYSSTFAEVRRDTAAAFATLSFNGKPWIIVSLYERAAVDGMELVDRIFTCRFELGYPCRCRCPRRFACTGRSQHKGVSATWITACQ
jgi:hypothetical protein